MAKERLEPHRRSSAEEGDRAARSADYGESDLGHVLEVSRAHDWFDAIRYLDEKGMEDADLTPGEATGMRGDLQAAARRHVGFVTDPKLAYRRVHDGDDAER